MIPQINDSEMRKKALDVFTIKNFKSVYLQILHGWYRKDNKGEQLKKPKLGILDGQSYDKTYKAIEKMVSKFTNENELLKSNMLNKVQKELKKYKGEKSPNKLKYVKKVLYYINMTNDNIENMVRYLVTRNDPTSIRDYVKILENHLECHEIKKLYDLYITKLSKPEGELDKEEDEMETLKGLPNSGNYCFLNSAIQQLFGLSAFKNKVLIAKNIPENQEEYKELFALRQIFEHLKGKMTLSKVKIQKHMVSLGYRNKQEDSGEYMEQIMKTVVQQLKTLNKKAPKIVNITNMFDLQVTESASLIELIKQFCNVKIDLGEFPTLVLKEGQFIIKLVRQSKEYEVKNLEIMLDLSEISPGFIHIKTSRNSEPLESPKFNLIGITTQTGTAEAGHYVIYRKLGNTFKCIDDMGIIDVKWDKLQKILPKNATVLVYKKI